MPRQRYTVEVDSKVSPRLRRQLNAAAAAANRLTAATGRADRRFRRFATTQRFVVRSMRGTINAFRTAGRAMFSFRSILLGFATFALIRALDNITRLENRLRTAGVGGEEANQVIDVLNDTANETGGNIAQLAAIFGRFVFSLKDTSATVKETTLAVKSLARSATAMGITAQEARGGLIQLSQGLASGRLQGEELRSVLETLPSFARQLATTVGVSYGQIREEARLGRISIEQMRQAFVDFRDTANAQFANFRLPIIGALQALANELARLVEEIFRRAGLKEGTSGAVQSLTQAVKELRESLDDIQSPFSKFIGFLVVGFKGIGRLIIGVFDDVRFALAELGIRAKFFFEGLILALQALLEKDTERALGNISLALQSLTAPLVSDFRETEAAANALLESIRRVAREGYKFGERRNLQASPLPKTPQPVPNLPLIQRAEDLVRTVAKVTNDIRRGRAGLIKAIDDVPFFLRDRLDGPLKRAAKDVRATGEIIETLNDVSFKLANAAAKAATAPADKIAETTKALTKEIKSAEKALKRFDDRANKTDRETIEFNKQVTAEQNKFIGEVVTQGANVLGGEGSQFGSSVGNIAQGALVGGPVGAAAAAAKEVIDRSVAAGEEVASLTSTLDGLNTEYHTQVGIEAQARAELKKTTKGTSEYNKALGRIASASHRLSAIERDRIVLEEKLNAIDADAAERGQKLSAARERLNEATKRLFEALSPLVDLVTVLVKVMALLVEGIGAVLKKIAEGIDGFFDGIVDFGESIYNLATGQDPFEPWKRDRRRARNAREREQDSQLFNDLAQQQFGELLSSRSYLNRPLERLTTELKRRFESESREDVVASLNLSPEGLAKRYGFQDPEAIKIIAKYLTNPFEKLTQPQLQILRDIAFGIDEENDTSKKLLEEQRKQAESLKTLLMEQQNRNKVLQEQLAAERRLEGERRDRAISAVAGPGDTLGGRTPITINNVIDREMLVNEIASQSGENAILNVINANREQVRDVLASAS